MAIPAHPVAVRKSASVNVPLPLCIHTNLILLAGSVGCLRQNGDLVPESSIVLLLNIASNAANGTL